MMDRVKLSREDVSEAMKRVEAALYARLDEKGYGTFSSTHEIRGVLDEEYNELREAMHANDYEAIESELLDLAVGAIFGYACVNGNFIDW